MSSSALRAAWEAAQHPEDGSALRAAWEAAQQPPKHDSGLILRRNERGRINDREKDEAGDGEATYAQKALGGIASLASEIPGAEFLQAGARSLVRGQPYSEALDDIRGAEDASGAVGTVNKMIGGGLGYAALPSAVRGVPVSNMARGALYGAANGFTDADPEANRGLNTVVGGVLGGALGAGGDALGAGARKARGFLAKQVGKESEMARKIAAALKPSPKSLVTESASQSALRSSTPPPPPRGGVRTRPAGPAIVDESPGVESAIESTLRSPPSRAPAIGTVRGRLAKVIPDDSPGVESAIESTLKPRAAPPPAVGSVRGRPLRSVLDDSPATESAMESVLRQASEPPPARGGVRTRPATNPLDVASASGPRAAPSSVDEKIMSLLNQMRRAQPSEIGNVWGDAEIAQGLHVPEPDLESLLRQSLKLIKPNP